MLGGEVWPRAAARWGLKGTRPHTSEAPEVVRYGETMARDDGIAMMRAAARKAGR